MTKTRVKILYATNWGAKREKIEKEINDFLEKHVQKLHDIKMAVYPAGTIATIIYE